MRMLMKEISVAFRGLFAGSADNVTPQQAHAKQREGALMLDVREPSEWREGHIPDAKLIPLGTLGSRLFELDRNKEIVAVCRSGNRSAMAVRMLKSQGFTRVHNLAGGMIAWTQARLPVTR